MRYVTGHRTHLAYHSDTVTPECRRVADVHVLPQPVHGIDLDRRVLCQTCGFEGYGYLAPKAGHVCINETS